MAEILNALVAIVGADYVSAQAEERYFYARDPGLTSPHEPDYVVLPKTTEEVRQILLLANREKVGVVPKGGGLALTGLVIPQRGGILLDMKRMGRVLEVNESGRYAVVEAGVSQGTLKAYLAQHHPDLRHSVPDAPPIATVVANAVIHGQGRLTQQYGFNSDMVTGLEVVLPTGEVCRIGSCSVGPYWFSKGAPMPDLSGLFLGWLGTTGVITKLGLRLYPQKKLRDVEVFVTDLPELVPEVVYKITHSEMLEDINVWFQPQPLMFQGNHHITMYFTGDSEAELEFKRRMIADVLQEYLERKDGGFMWVLPDLKPTFMDMPQKSLAAFADVRKGATSSIRGRSSSSRSTRPARRSRQTWPTSTSSPRTPACPASSAAATA